MSIQQRIENLDITGSITNPALSLAKLVKTDKLSVAFAVSTTAPVKTAQAIVVRNAAGTQFAIAANTDAPLDTGSLAAGTDYAVHVTAAGALVSSATFTPPTGGTLIGGFHYAPGGNATGTTGGDTTPAVNPYSIWDLNFRPACPDPRGMVLIAGRFWMDIYLTNDNPTVYGTSAYNRPIADGATLAVIPAMWGGNGTTKYTDHNWWTSAQIFRAYGKALPSLDELADATYGANQGSATVLEPTATDLLVNGSASGLLTSKFGIIQSFGAMWVWSRDSGDTGDLRALMGDNWSSGGNAGSRYALWVIGAPNSYSNIGCRGRSDHLITV